MGRFFTIIAIVVLAMSLAGCQTAAELAQKEDAQCKSYGAHPGEPAYVQCRTMLAVGRENREAESDAVVAGAMLSRH